MLALVALHILVPRPHWAWVWSWVGDLNWPVRPSHWGQTFSARVHHCPPRHLLGVTSG